MTQGSAPGIGHAWSHSFPSRRASLPGSKVRGAPPTVSQWILRRLRERGFVKGPRYPFLTLDARSGHLVASCLTRAIAELYATA